MTILRLGQVEPMRFPADVLPDRKTRLAGHWRGRNTAQQQGLAFLRRQLNVNGDTAGLLADDRHGSQVEVNL